MNFSTTNLQHWFLNKTELKPHQMSKTFFEKKVYLLCEMGATRVRNQPIPQILS